MSRFSADVLARAMAAVYGQTATAPAPLTPESYQDLAVEVCAALCRRFEGFYSKPYLCPAGVPTIGYGATRYLDGRRVKLTDAPISKATAERLLLGQIKRVYLPAVLRQCPLVRDPKALGALIDFTFNLGEPNLKASTLRRKVNANDWEGAKREIVKWVYAGGVRLRGLELRRQAEAAYF